MKSIVLSSLLAIVGCVTLSVVVALIAAPSDPQGEDFQDASPTVANSMRRPG